MEDILTRAKKVAEKAEVFRVTSYKTPVHFEANRLKQIQTKESTSTALRIIKDGRIGFAHVVGQIEPDTLVQMALDTAKNNATQEFKEALAMTGKDLSDLRDYVKEHPELQRPTYPIPQQNGVTGRAAKFVLHVADLMNGNTSPISQRR